MGQSFFLSTGRGPARKKIQVILENFAARYSVYFLTITRISKVRPRGSKPHLRNSNVDLRNSKVFLRNSKICLKNSKICLRSSKVCLGNSKNDLINSKENLGSPNLDKKFILIYLTNKVRGLIVSIIVRQNM